MVFAVEFVSRNLGKPSNFDVFRGVWANHRVKRGIRGGGGGGGCLVSLG